MFQTRIIHECSFVTLQIFYEQRIPIRIAQSSQRLLLLCRGQGLEPRLEFDHQLVEFGPILPHSNGVEQEVVICNPCNFPIEFYSLEFDQQYLEEEKVGFKPSVIDFQTPTVWFSQWSCFQFCCFSCVFFFFKGRESGFLFCLHYFYIHYDQSKVVRQA